mmetsp:Transcript_43175/g.111928  ORF Transcript_43175/g.111928 Transcript_43175/m.111928 type:complete len:570 (+) Transcript_43175:1480-3189(+)
MKRRFEEEQMRRVMGRRTFEQQKEKERKEKEVKEMQWGSEKSTSAVPPPPYSSLEDVRVRMEALLNGRKEKVEVIEKQLEGTKREKENLTAQLEEYDKTISDSNSAYVFYQDMRTYMETLVGCFKEKNTLIAEAEMELIDIDNTCFGAIKQRQKEEIEEERDFLAGVLDRGGLEVDEFGRDTSSIKKTRIKDRHQHRMERVKKRKAKSGEHADVFDQSGFSSDEDSVEVEDMEKREDERRVIVNRVAGVFDDVEEQFASILAVKKKFAAWRKLYVQSYADTYAADSLPKIFSPFVRLELMEWDPVTSAQLTLDRLSFIDDLFDFGYNAGGKEEEQDDKLIPRLIEQVALPRLRDALSRRYMPFSFRSTQVAVEAVEQAMMFRDDISEKGRERLLDTVRDMIEEAVLSLPLSYADKINRGDAMKVEVLLRHFYRALKLLGNTFMWESVFGIEEVEKIAVEGLLQRYIMPFLRDLPQSPTDFSLYEAAVHSLPEEWRRRRQGGVQLVLGPFHEQFRKVSERTLQSARARGLSADVVHPIAKGIIRVLQAMNDTNAALAVANSVGIPLPTSR